MLQQSPLGDPHSTILQPTVPATRLEVQVLLVHAGIAELVQELQRRQTAVYLVSGGFRAIINPIAEILTIPLENVYANTILYDVSLAASHSWNEWVHVCQLLTDTSCCSSRSHWSAA